MTVKVELFTTDFCPHCAAAKTALNTAVQELGPDHFDVRMLDVVREIDYAAEIGVLKTPAVVVDGELAYITRATVVHVKKILQNHISVVSD